MEIGVIPHKYKYVKLSKKEKSKTHGRKTSALSARKIGCRAKMHARRTPKNQMNRYKNSTLKRFHVQLAEREKKSKKENKNRKKGATKLN